MLACSSRNRVITDIKAVTQYLLCYANMCDVAEFDWMIDQFVDNFLNRPVAYFPCQLQYIYNNSISSPTAISLLFSPFTFHIGIPSISSLSTRSSRESSRFSNVSNGICIIKFQKKYFFHVYSMFGSLQRARATLSYRIYSISSYKTLCCAAPSREIVSVAEFLHNNNNDCIECVCSSTSSTVRTHFLS